MRVVALWVLATWCAECVWGGFTVVDYPVVLLFLGPLYGSVAVLIREVARRRGGGWPVMVLLAVASGLVQAGLVDQSLFDRSALEGTGFAEAGREAAATWVPALGFSAGQLFEFVSGHVWWSVCAPIAVVEAWSAPEVRRVSWRGVAGLVVLYVLASLVNWSDSGRVVSGSQVAAVLVVVAGLVAAASWWRPSPPAVTSDHGRGRGGVPALWLGVVVLAAHVGSWFYGSGWAGLGLRVVTVLVVGVLVVRWAVSERHVLAGWGAGLVAGAGVAFLAPPYAAAASWLMVVSDVFGAVLVGVLLWGRWSRSSPVPAGLPGGGPRCRR
ncbi:hypothetical protein [Actinoplanes subglobosus]|uniref:Uncharacterized protein n=1 Tax=Actinoplanes subglobosus TaxID=1547892 RepID=A0ABV8IZM5_9ACTN